MQSDPRVEHRVHRVERFARGTTERNGVGLGLAIVQGHTRLHRGRVEVGASPFGGARFVVHLPLDPD